MHDPGDALVVAVDGGMPVPSGGPFIRRPAPPEDSAVPTEFVPGAVAREPNAPPVVAERCDGMLPNPPLKAAAGEAIKRAVMRARSDFIGDISSNSSIQPMGPGRGSGRKMSQVLGFDMSRLWLSWAHNRGSLPMRVVLAAVMLAALAGPAVAQQSHVPRYGEEEKDKTSAEKAADKAAAQAYQRSLGAIPDKGPQDPWGAVRSNDGPKPATTKTAKSAKGKTATTEAKPQ
jgi:hypothetical protein